MLFYFLGGKVKKETTSQQYLQVCLISKKQSNNTFIYIHLKMKSFCSSSLCYTNFRSKTGTGDKMKYYRLPKNPKTQNKYQKILMTTGLN